MNGRMSKAIKLLEAALIATVYDVSQEAKNVSKGFGQIPVKRLS
jgi:hypothetical protein